jgi:uncharacterized membrane protein YGL010W
MSALARKRTFVSVIAMTGSKRLGFSTVGLSAVRPSDPVSLNSAPHSALLRTAMSGIFHRQLAEYADYHRDQRNCLMHIIGNPILFVAAVLPLSLMSVTVFGVQTSAAPLLVIPALILWIAWDVGLGLAIVSAAIPLLLIAAIIANHVCVAAVWGITALLTAIGWALQIVGHQFFEQRRPALLDNPIHMLISPMYLFAKLFVALGFRRDLAALLQKSSA